MPQHDIFSKVVAGEVQLLTAEQICERLGVSRPTFDRWVRNSEPLVAKLRRQKSGSGGLASALAFETHMELQPLASEEDRKTSFPQPDVRIGKSPRWLFETVVSWLRTTSEAPTSGDR